MLGLLLQIGIVAIIGYLLWTWWQRRNQPALASGPALRDANADELAFAHELRQYRLRQAAGFGGGSGVPATATRASGTDEVGLTPDDFNAFEKILTDVQAAYSAEDLARLRREATPEMLSYFSEDLATNASKGVVNRVSDVKLLQGDLAEAWREGDTDYATVAMRYSLNDEMVDRESGRVVESRRGRSHGNLDLHARTRRSLAGVGDPADLMQTAAGISCDMAGTSSRPCLRVASCRLRQRVRARCLLPTHRYFGLP